MQDQYFILTPLDDTPEGVASRNAVLTYAATLQIIAPPIVKTVYDTMAAVLQGTPGAKGLNPQDFAAATMLEPGAFIKRCGENTMFQYLGAGLFCKLPDTYQPAGPERPRWWQRLKDRALTWCAAWRL